MNYGLSVFISDFRFSKTEPVPKKSIKVSKRIYIFVDHEVFTNKNISEPMNSLIINKGDCNLLFDLNVHYNNRI